MLTKQVKKITARKCICKTKTKNKLKAGKTVAARDDVDSHACVS